MSDEYTFDSDREVITANADAEVRKLEARAKVYEARAKLHPFVQLTQSLFEGIEDAIAKIGCIGATLVVVTGVAFIFAALSLNVLICR